MSWTSGVVKELRDFIDGFFDVPGNFNTGLFGGTAPNESGADVNEQSSMTVGAVAACQRIISSAVASMSCYVYQRMPDGGHKLATNHPLFETLSLRPNPEYPAVDFFSAGQVNLLQNGNCYAEIQETNGGDQQLLLRSPFRTHVYRDRTTGEITYRTTDTVDGRERVIEAKNMVHVKNMGVVPYIGLSPIRLYMREIIGTALAAQAYGARLFKNDARPGGYLSTDKALKPEEQLKQVQSWVAGHTGRNNHMVALLDNGMKWEQVGINPDEAQFLQTRDFQRSEIASIYGVPAHMLGDKQETKATIEQKALEFLLWTVKIWLRRWEHAINVKLMPTRGQTAGLYFAKFDTSEFERADYATMLKGIQTGRYAGLYSVNEGRKLLGLNPTTPDNFDETKPGMGLWRPVNMAVAGEDPSTYAAGGSGASADNSDAPAEDQPAPADDGGDDSRSYPGLSRIFQDALGRIAKRKDANSAVWQRTLSPILGSIADDFLPEDSRGLALPDSISLVIGGVIAGMEIKGAQATWDNQQPILSEAITAIVRAARAHLEEIQ